MSLPGALPAEAPLPSFRERQMCTHLHHSTHMHTYTYTHAHVFVQHRTANPCRWVLEAQQMQAEDETTGFVVGLLLRPPKGAQALTVCNSIQQLQRRKLFIATRSGGGSGEKSACKHPCERSTLQHCGAGTKTRRRFEND